MLAVFATLVVVLPAATPVEIDRALDEVLSDGDYQTKLPPRVGGLEWLGGNIGSWGGSTGSGGTGSGTGTGTGNTAPRAPDPNANTPPPATGPPRNPRSSSSSPSSQPPSNPGTTPPSQRDNVRWRESPQTIDIDSDDKKASPPAATGSSDVGKTLIYTLLIVLGALAILGIIAAIVQRFRHRDSAPQGVVKTVTAAERKEKVARVVVIDPPELSLIERLAAEGRYTEAVHELLRLAFEAASTQLGLVLPREATSRELLASLDIHDTQRTALKRIVGAVEVGHFGKRDLDVSEFAACREAFRVFEAGLAPRGGG